MGTRMQMSVPDRLLIILVPRVSLPPTPLERGRKTLGTRLAIYTLTMS